MSGGATTGAYREDEETPDWPAIPPRPCSPGMAGSSPRCRRIGSGRWRGALVPMRSPVRPGPGENDVRRPPSVGTDPGPIPPGAGSAGVRRSGPRCEGRPGELRRGGDPPVARVAASRPGVLLRAGAVDAPVRGWRIPCRSDQPARVLPGGRLRRATVSGPLSTQLFLPGSSQQRGPEEGPVSRQRIIQTLAPGRGVVSRTPPMGSSTSGPPCA